MTHIDKDWLTRTGGNFSEMTLLDHFAGQAMAAIIASEPDSWLSKHLDVRAQAAYAIADAMLKARELSK